MLSQELAKRIRKHAIRMVHNAHASHIGGILSCADIVAVLYNDVANIYPSNPHNDDRDRIILSKGHNGVAIYAALAEKGFFSVDKLETYGMDGSRFSCHVSHKKVPGVEISTGSLGQGVCVACGMALNAKLKKKDYKVYAIVGDGECNEGSIWEMAMLSHQYNLDNFTVIIDRNNMQAMGHCSDVLDINPLEDKWLSFGWTVINVADGHNHKMLREAFEKSFNGNPKVIIANTIKGKGISFMENELVWHYRDPQGEDYRNALDELDGKYEKSCD
ncbi:MAG: transketolase [Bacilli bacterium]|nr:transketolase [Bacilli bacterium]